MKKGIWCELMELHTINKEKPTEKFMGRERETAKEESEEYYPITARGLWDPLSTGEPDGVLGGDEAVRRSFLHLLLGDGGAYPTGGRVLGHDALPSQVFHTHPMRIALGGSERAD
jgi:hypothetical protein